jgi:hypothetical protein
MHQGMKGQLWNSQRECIHKNACLICIQILLVQLTLALNYAACAKDSPVQFILKASSIGLSQETSNWYRAQLLLLLTLRAHLFSMHRKHQKPIYFLDLHEVSIQ